MRQQYIERAIHSFLLCLEEFWVVHRSYQGFVDSSLHESYSRYVRKTLQAHNLSVLHLYQPVAVPFQVSLRSHPSTAQCLSSVTASGFSSEQRKEGPPGCCHQESLISLYKSLQLPQNMSSQPSLHHYTAFTGVHTLYVTCHKKKISSTSKAYSSCNTTAGWTRCDNSLY